MMVYLLGIKSFRFHPPPFSASFVWPALLELSPQALTTPTTAPGAQLPNPRFNMSASAVNCYFGARFQNIFVP